MRKNVIDNAFCEDSIRFFSRKLFSGLSSFTKTVFTFNFPSTVFDLLGDSHKFVPDCNKLNPILFSLFWRWSRVVIVSSSSLCLSVISSKMCPNNTYNCRENIYWCQFNWTTWVFLLPSGLHHKAFMITSLLFLQISLLRRVFLWNFFNSISSLCSWFCTLLTLALLMLRKLLSRKLVREISSKTFWVFWFDLVF